jgi:hypothetical protein
MEAGFYARVSQESQAEVYDIYLCHRKKKMWGRIIDFQASLEDPNNYTSRVDFQKQLSWAPVAHTCNPSYLGG